MTERAVRRERHEQLPAMVASYVQELIVTGAVAPGSFLRIEPIATALGVSNTPVREGLLALRNEGYVQLRPRKGFVVARFEDDDVWDLYWAASKIAGELAARAAGSTSADDLEAAESAIDALARALEAGDTAVASAASHAFHRHVNLAACSPRLASILRSIVDNLPLRLYRSIEAQLVDTVEEHRAIHDAIRASDPETARQLMECHVRAGADRLLDSLRANGAWASAPGLGRAAGESRR